MQVDGPTPKWRVHLSKIVLAIAKFCHLVYTALALQKHSRQNIWCFGPRPLMLVRRAALRSFLRWPRGDHASEMRQLLAMKMLVWINEGCKTVGLRDWGSPNLQILKTRRRISRKQWRQLNKGNVWCECGYEQCKENFDTRHLFTPVLSTLFA